MKVKFKHAPNGDCIAETKLHVPGGGVVILRAVTTRAEARAMLARAQQRVGWKLSFKSLGRAIKAVAKPATLLKVTTMAAGLIANPASIIKVGPGLLNEIKNGMAAKRVVQKASAGDPRAKALVQQATAAAQQGGGAAHSPPPGVPDQTWRYLVTLERLAQSHGGIATR
jgi:hypothetical protein